MKLRNKKTGEVAVFGEGIVDLHQIGCKNVAEMVEAGWEDYEEPKAYWYIDDAGVMQVDQILSSKINMRKSIGNYFDTKEEAEKAVEKLKAWKRLRDKGFKFDGYHIPAGEIHFDIEIPKGSLDEIAKDFTFLFGGEEEDE